MGMTSCRECGKPVSSKAKACPHCGVVRPRRTSLLTWVVTIFVGVGVVAILAGQNATAPPKPAPPKDPCNGVDALYATRGYVRQILKSPGSATFALPADSAAERRPGKECRFLVQSWVDAKNPMGVVLRTRYQAEAELLPDGRWRVTGFREL